MTTITINRATVEQALEALDHEIDTRRCKASTLRAMISLRAALAQQDEPAREWVSMDEYKRLQGLVTSQGIRLMEYESKQPQQAEPVKPVAQYSDIVSDGGMDPRNKYDTAPPQRTMVPLTEEEIDRIDACIDESTPLKEGKSLFARAIENASWEKNHGQT